MKEIPINTIAADILWLGKEREGVRKKCVCWFEVVLHLKMQGQILRQGQRQGGAD